MIMEDAEAQWRLQFADLVLLQEATPWWFVPLPYALPWSSDASRRPKHHVSGKLSIIDERQEKKEIECWFLLMEVVAGDEHQGQADEADSFFAAHKAPHKDSDLEREQMLLLRAMSQRLDRMEQKLESQQQAPGDPPADPLPPPPPAPSPLLTLRTEQALRSSTRASDEHAVQFKASDATACFTSLVSLDLP